MRSIGAAVASMRLAAVMVCWAMFWLERISPTYCYLKEHLFDMIYAFVAGTPAGTAAGRRKGGL